MNFDVFETMDFPPTLQNAPGFIYIFFWTNESEEVPFYVGMTSRLRGRLNDYVWAPFSASTDFRVGTAISYLIEKGYRIRARYKFTTDPRREEREMFEGLRGAGFSLLNDMSGYDYQIANQAEERLRVRKQIDDLIVGGSRPIADIVKDSPPTVSG